MTLPAVTDTEAKDQLRKIIKIDPSKGGYISYAIAYAKVGLTLSGVQLRAQIPYVLSNLSSWTGEEAREAKVILNRYLRNK
jgi:hypothetical protein